MKELLADREKLAALSENAARIYIKDTDDRIYSALAPLIEKAESK